MQAIKKVEITQMHIATPPHQYTRMSAQAKRANERMRVQRWPRT